VNVTQSDPLKKTNVFKFKSYTINPATGLAMFKAEIIRGGKKPWFVEDTSSLAEEAGDVVPTPTCACVNVDATKNNKPIKIDFLKVCMYIDYLCL
jgi:hypothetical protein